MDAEGRDHTFSKGIWRGVSLVAVPPAAVLLTDVIPLT
jgi:hypothetical protein